MKRLIISLIATCGIIAPMVAMDGPKKLEGKNTETLLNMYFDKREFAKTLTPMMIDLGFDGDIDKKKAAKGFLKALKIELLPITLKSGRKSIVGEFFDPEKLKVLLKKVMSHNFDGKFERKRFPKYLKLLKESMKMDAVKKEVGNSECVELDKSFDTLIAFYSGEPTGEIEECIKLEKLPSFFGFLVQDSCIVPKLNAALNEVLKGKAITMDSFLECVDFDQIQLRAGYDPSELISSEGIREACYSYFNFMHDDKSAFKSFFDIFGQVRETRKAKEGQLVVVDTTNN